MKKKNFKNLSLNKKIISNLKGGRVTINALTEDSCLGGECGYTEDNSCLPIKCGITQVNNSNCYCPQ
ncbi:hypothetical protein GTQ40_04700 [Flavobacteriaceae bacterium R38]|nr:hypothetical protein [Flavobacteriaceae bacterium R38]